MLYKGDDVLRRLYSESGTLHRRLTSRHRGVSLAAFSDVNQAKINPSILP